MDYGNVILGYFSFLCWTANSLDIYIVFLVISAVYWSCLVFFLFFLFFVFERCFLDYSLHQFGSLESVRLISERISQDLR